RIVEPDHRDVARHRTTEAAYRADRAERVYVARAYQRASAAVDQARRGGVAALHREHRALDELGLELATARSHGRTVARQLSRRRHVIGRTEDKCDPFVPDRGEVHVRLLDALPALDPP